VGNYFKKFFGVKESEVPKAAPPASLDPSKNPNMIRVFDSYGRECFITREQWRDSILVEHLKKVWNDPEGLSATITQSLKDKFFAEMVKPAKHLLTIDPKPERAAMLLAVTYLQLGQLNHAEKILQQHIQKHGESGWILTNLAKVYSGRGEDARSLETLWRGLQRDPNQDKAVGWYEVIHREKGGQEESVTALRRIAAVPGSWRAQLWLARAAVEDSNLTEALRLYRESIAAAGDPVPNDLLAQMSGDLGKAGYLPELIEMTSPHFKVDTHGLHVGNNLIKAHLDLGQIDTARDILQQLYAQNRPDWKQTLTFWDTEIAKTGVAAAVPLSPEKLTITDLAIEGPIWLPEDSPANELFSAHAAESVRIYFLGGTAEIPSRDDKITAQLSDTRGRLSRAIPLFLAEQIHFHSDGVVRTLVPLLKSESSGFVLSGMRWADDDAASRARMGNTQADYIVLLHLRTMQEPWTLELRLVRTIDAACLASFEVSYASNGTLDSIHTSACRLKDELRAHAEVTSVVPSALYQVPGGADFPYYLLRLEQLLAIRCSGLAGVQDSSLSGEREIVDGNLHLCLNHPKNATARILLLQTFRSLGRVRPAIAEEYREKVRRLQREYPLEEPIQSVLNRMLDFGIVG